MPTKEKTTSEGKEATAPEAEAAVAAPAAENEEVAHEDEAGGYDDDAEVKVTTLPPPLDADNANANAPADADADDDDAPILPPKAKKPKTNEAGWIEHESGRLIKPKCSCPKSQCLKLYCDCFFQGNFCGKDCTCNKCCNTPEHDEGARLEAIRYVLSRKPDAFTPELRAKATGDGWKPHYGVRPGFFKTTKKAKKLKKKARKMKMETREESLKKKAKTIGGKTVKHADGLERPTRRAVAPAAARALAAAKSTPKEKFEEEENVSSSSDEEEEVALKTGIPFSVTEFPQLALDEDDDYSDLASAFTKPLFEEPSRPLEIAYSQHAAAQYQRKLAQKKKNDILVEYDRLKAKFQAKKLELSLANDYVKIHNERVGAWTRKVFDLELEEPCTWNTNYKKLKEYKETHGKLPPKVTKTENEEEKFLARWVDSVRGQKNQEESEQAENASPKKKYGKKKNSMSNYPHRIDSLAKLGVVWVNQTENKFETMFQKLLIYKQEMGTMRFPTDEQCAATGDQELIALQKWVKSQVINFRYGKKNTPNMKRLLDIGFDSEKWYAKPGKKRKSAETKGANVNEVVDDRKMPAKVDGDVEMSNVDESATV